MKCYKCGDTGGILSRTVSLGEICEDWICDRCLKGLPTRKIPDDSPFIAIELREKRIQFQLDEWVKGNSIHNHVDDECCPDFSCCNKDVVTEQIIKDLFYNANSEERERLLFQFLSNAISTYTDKKVFIADGESEITKNLN